jgi:NADPH2:quinone reductase
MKAVLCRELSGAEGLRLEEVSEAHANAGQVLVQVHAAGVNFLDGLIITGQYQSTPVLPFVPGCEISGVIVKVGADVKGLHPGMRVLGFTGVGAFAEAVALDPWRVFPIPEAMDFATAAGFLVTYGTSHHALKDRAALRTGETLLVLGAAGGVGLAAVEIGRVMGAHVIAVASSDEKLALCRHHGADAVINYTTEDLRARVKALTQGRGVDVVYDPVGGQYAEPMVRSLRHNGRYLVVGFAAGSIPKIPLNLLLLKMASLIGVYWGAFAEAEPQQAADNMAQLMRWYIGGQLQPHVAVQYPLSAFQKALNDIIERRAMGKVILLMNPSPPQP